MILSYISGMAYQRESGEEQEVFRCRLSPEVRIGEKQSTANDRGKTEKSSFFLESFCLRN